MFVRGPTHVGGNTLDLLTSSNPDMVVDVEKLGYLGNGDHLMLEASLVGPAKDEETTQLVPDWTKADLEAMKDSIANIDWVLEFGDPYDTAESSIFTPSRAPQTD